LSDQFFFVGLDLNLHLIATRLRHGFLRSQRLFPANRSNSDTTISEGNTAQPTQSKISQT
jgi:hypothetical protein